MRVAHCSRAALALREADLAALQRSLEETVRAASEAEKHAVALGTQLEELRRRREALKDAAGQQEAAGTGGAGWNAAIHNSMKPTCSPDMTPRASGPVLAQCASCLEAIT
jgi:hypothetical protein